MIGLGVLALLVAITAAFFLSLSHLGTDLPGCGADSACAKVTNGVWGTIPGLEWPTAFLGLAWFGALVPTWLLCAGRLPIPVVGLVALGVAGSLLLTGVMIVDGTVCRWCLASHVANVGFGMVAWIGRRGSAAAVRPRESAPAIAATTTTAAAIPRSGPALATFLLVGVSMTGGLAVAKQRVEARARDIDRANLDAAGDAIIARAGQADGQNGTPLASDPTANPTVDLTGGDADANANANANADADADAVAWHGTLAAAVAPPSDPAVITGRWRIGPARAAIRFVVFFDYQCEFCRRIEEQITRVVKARDDVSLEIRHFPFCRDCNRIAAAANANPHPNACWAARAAEAAGRIGGPAAFWDMHEALFGLSPPGAFTDTQLESLLVRLDHDPATFQAVMTDGVTLGPVEADVELGADIGVARTPMVFVNGIELIGWQRAGAVDEIVTRLTAADLPRQTAEEAGDRPPRGADRFIAAWRDAPVQPALVLERPADQPRPATGGPLDVTDRTVRLVVWTDPAIASVRRLERRLDALIARHPMVQIEYRHYPLDPACNPGAPRDLEAGSCLAARIVAAAEVLGGPGAALRARSIVVAAPAPVQDGVVRVAAAAAGLDADELRAAMAAPATAAVIAGDVAAGQRVGLRGVPHVLVDGRRLGRFDYGELDVLTTIVEAAIDTRN